MKIIALYSWVEFINTEVILQHESNIELNMSHAIAIVNVCECCNRNIKANNSNFILCGKDV